MTVNEYVNLKKSERRGTDKTEMCDAPEGRTYLAIGQDLSSIRQYITSQYDSNLLNGGTRPTAHFQPAATMFYTDIQTLRGLDAPVDYGSGIEYADGLVRQARLMAPGAFVEASGSGRRLTQTRD